jgi:hypothetical protein
LGPHLRFALGMISLTLDKQKKARLSEKLSGPFEFNVALGIAPQHAYHSLISSNVFWSRG